MVRTSCTSANLATFRPNVVGPGGIFMPRQYELEEIVDGDSITVMCFTWNINCKPASGLRRLNEVFAKIPPQERPDLIAVALQELPTSTFKFHHQMVGILGEALETTHRVYCWVRKWSQMLIIFIRKRLSLYTSHPEYRFVATSRVAKPFRTKGAIGICFRILQTSIVFIACHLTHGKLKRRILDYHKLSKAFDFQGIRRHPANKHSSETQSVLDQMKNAANVFWFGDLNFRVAKTKESDGLGKRLEDRLFRKALDYEAILLHDELSLEIAKGLVFEGFREPMIKFPPTHKFINGTNRYAPHRVPSYTDRVLYWSRSEDSLQPLRYDSIWEITLSDHKPVYCIFRMKVLEKRVNSTPKVNALLMGSSIPSTSGSSESSNIVDL